MESVLIGVTVISLGLAITMSIVAWTLLKAERQRAAARIEALEALAFSREPERPEPVAAPKVVAPRRDESAPAELDFAPELPDWDAVIRGDSDDGSEDRNRLEIPMPARSARAVLPAAMFFTEPASNAGARRLLAVAAIGLLIAAGYATASAMRSPEVVAAVAASTPPPSAEPQPLELLSLKHSPDSTGTFTISGFVQNPAGGKDLTNVEVVVYLFDQQDQYFMTGRAALETADLRTGTDSGFAVHVSGVTNVGRYRVGFRQADGTVVAHIDRRGQFPDGSSETVVGTEPVLPAGSLR
jgi:hypothetical protein